MLLPSQLLPSLPPASSQGLMWWCKAAACTRDGRGVKEKIGVKGMLAEIVHQKYMRHLPHPGSNWLWVILCWGPWAGRFGGGGVHFPHHFVPLTGVSYG